LVVRIVVLALVLVAFAIFAACSSTDDPCGLGEHTAGESCNEEGLVCSFFAECYREYWTCRSGRMVDTTPPGTRMNCSGGPDVFAPPPRDAGAEGDAPSFDAGADALDADAQSVDAGDGD
jgi:hypothetical protein